MSALAAELPRIFALVPLHALREATGRSDSTVRNWIDGKNTPLASDLLTLMREFDEIADAVLETTGRTTSNITHEQRRKLLQIIGEP